MSISRRMQGNRVAVADACCNGNAQLGRAARLHGGLRWNGPVLSHPQAPSGPCTHGARSQGSALALASPAGHVQQATNSWLYAPLLQAAAADLTSPVGNVWPACTPCTKR